MGYLVSFRRIVWVILWWVFGFFLCDGLVMAVCWWLQEGICWWFCVHFAGEFGGEENVVWFPFLEDAWIFFTWRSWSGVFLGVVLGLLGNCVVFHGSLRVFPNFLRPATIGRISKACWGFKITPKRCQNLLIGELYGGRPFDFIWISMMFQVTFLSRCELWICFGNVFGGDCLGICAVVFWRICTCWGLMVTIQLAKKSLL